MTEIMNIQNIFLIVSLFSTILYILKTIIFMATGGDAEVQADFNATTETDTSFSFLSVQSLLAFFMGFGWSGLAALEQFKTSTTTAIIAAFIIGLIFMYGSAYLMYSIKKLNKTIKKDINELTNKYGRTYTTFPPKGEGQIEIEFNKKLSILNAINLSEEKIDAFVQIKVQKVENNIIYIEKI